MRVVGQRSSARVTQGPRHPEVDQQRPSRFETDNQILATAPDRRDALPDELARDDRRVERPHEAWIANLDVLEECPFEHRRDRPTNGFDFGQFRHGVSLG